MRGSARKALERSSGGGYRMQAWYAGLGIYAEEVRYGQYHRQGDLITDGLRVVSSCPRYPHGPARYILATLVSTSYLRPLVRPDLAGTVLSGLTKLLQTFQGIRQMLQSCLPRSKFASFSTLFFFYLTPGRELLLLPNYGLYQTGRGVVSGPVI